MGVVQLVENLPSVRLWLQFLLSHKTEHGGAHLMPAFGRVRQEDQMFKAFPPSPTGSSHPKLHETLATK